MPKVKKMKKLCIGVTGINAVDNPGPGIGVIRSLKECKDLNVEIVGLAYDAMEPGIYMDWLVDKSFILPYPSTSEEEYISRLLYIKDRACIDMIIPTLDAEMPFFIKSKEKLESYGIKTFTPSQEQFNLRSKAKLEETSLKIGIKTPKSKTVTSYDELTKAIEELDLPVMVKGAFYKAYRAYTHQEAVGFFRKIVAEWGYPVIVQQVVSGEEMNVVGVGDGEGGDLGLVAIKKLWITSLGKIWTGVTVKNGKLFELAKTFIEKTLWKGAFELECIVDHDDIYLIEVNPRFPAWVYFATGVGINLPSRMVKKAFGMDFDNSTEYEAGKLYVRYTYDIVTDLSLFQKITMKGESL